MTLVIGYKVPYRKCNHNLKSYSSLNCMLQVCSRSHCAIWSSKFRIIFPLHANDLYSKVVFIRNLSGKSARRVNPSHRQVSRYEASPVTVCGKKISPKKSPRLIGKKSPRTSGKIPWKKSPCLTGSNHQSVWRLLDALHADEAEATTRSHLFESVSLHRSDRNEASTKTRSLTNTVLH